MRTWLLRLGVSPATYPTTITYLAGVAVVLGVAQGMLKVEYGIVALTLLSLLVVLVAMMRELRTVHLLVNSQRDELLLRIEDLVAALHQAGVAIPRESTSDERAARGDSE